MIFSWLGLTIIYFILGVVCAFAMFAFFRPDEGFVPSITIRVTAFLVFSVFWPIIFLLSLTHFIGTVYRYLIGETLELRFLGVLYSRTKFAGVSHRQKEWYSEER